MDPRSSDFLISLLMKRLYEDNGELPLPKAIQFIRVNSPKKMLNTDEDIKHWLVKLMSNYFKLKRDVIVGITSARLCDKHCYEPGSCRGGCDKLHMCRFFILKKEFKCQKECRFEHDFKTPHNNEILHKYKLQFLKEDELRRLFRKTENRNQQTLPVICRNFNMSKCEKKSCRFLHICKRFIVGKCPFENNCRLRHVIDSKIITTLNDYAIYLPVSSKDGLHELRLLYSANEPSANTHTGLSKACSVYDLHADNSPENDFEKRRYSSQMNLSLSGSRQRTRNINKTTGTKQIKRKSKGICMKLLSGQPCSAEECNFHHKKFPYQWQYKISEEDDDWKDFDTSTNEDLEEKYRHLIDEFHVPGKNGFMRYNFEKMEFTNLKTEGDLRRLSTASSVLYPKSNCATIWTWYWKNDSECWMEYDANNPESPPLSSSEIEEKYLSNKTGKMNFIHQGTVCFIDFKEMFQMNGEKTAVLRRPKPFREINRKEDANKPKPKPVSKPKKRNNQRKPTTNTVHTKAEKRNDNKSELMTHFKIVELHKNDSEFQYISQKFNESMKARGAKIMGIETIQNGELQEEYERRKNKMTTKFGNPSSINEMDLFHGTHSTNISAISKQGFDVRLSGDEVGIIFGKGSYFTKKADYAHKYIIPENDVYKMILAKVLVGFSCKGKMTYVRPPLIDPDNKEGDFYNSCVDDVENPSVFVIFANDQMYPAYIITYEMTF